MSRFVVVSFYTKENGYDKLAERLIDSLREFNIECHVDAIDDLGSWIRNAQYTHEFLRRMLDRYPEKSIVWTDADSVLRQYPELFNILDCDLAAYRHEWRSGRIELLCGTMYFANNDSMKGFLDDCIKMDKQFPDRRGAVNLAETLKMWIDKIRFQDLPAQYCKIFDLMRNVPDPVFEHFQASRRFRRLSLPVTPAKAQPVIRMRR